MTLYMLRSGSRIFTADETEILLAHFPPYAFLSLPDSYECGAKPSKGTPKDKRLNVNKGKPRPPKKPAK